MATMKLGDSIKLTALAYLYQGKTPKEVVELVEGISYAQALRLNKELKLAKDNNTISQLFNLSGAAVDILLEQTKAVIEANGIPLTGTLLSVDKTLDDLKDDIKETQILKAELARAGTEVVKKIRLLAAATNSSAVILELADALSRMQASYFKTASININPGAGFDDFLSKP